MKPVHPGAEFAEHVEIHGEEQLDSSPLPVFHGLMGTEQRDVYITRWTFTAEERARIAAGEDVALLSWDMVPRHCLSLFVDAIGSPERG